MAVSITYRPKDLDAEKDIVSFKKFIKTISDKYYIGCERGMNGIIPNHYQCYIESSKRYDKIRQRIIDNFALDDPLHSLVVRQVHQDALKYILGYCQKEVREYGYKCRSNIDDEYLQECYDYYMEHHEEMEKKNNRKKGKKTTFDMDKIFEDVLELHLRMNLEVHDHNITDEYLGKLLNKQHCYTLVQRINDFKFDECINLALKYRKK